MSVIEANKREQIVTLTSNLVSIPSVTSDQESCLEVMEYVASLFEGTDYNLQHFESKGVPSLIISKREDHHYSIAFVGHLDVVPGPEGCFHTRIEGDRLYGRGTADMKGNCAVMIQLFLDNKDNPLFEDAALVLTGDEETGGVHGAGYLVEEIGVCAEVVVVPDGGGPLQPCIFEKGIQHARLSVKGVAAHGSRPWLGKSAIDILLQQLALLREEFPDRSEDEQWELSMNIGLINGGVTSNSVADFASASLDFRLPTGLTTKELRFMVQSVVTDGTLEFLGHGEAVSVNVDEPVYKLFCDVLVRNGGSAEGLAEHGACDARWFVPQGSVILITKSESSPFHVDDEWVSIPSLLSLYDAFEEFSRLYLSGAAKAGVQQSLQVVASGDGRNEDRVGAADVQVEDAPNVEVG